MICAEKMLFQLTMILDYAVYQNASHIVHNYWNAQWPSSTHNHPFLQFICKWKALSWLVGSLSCHCSRRANKGLKPNVPDLTYCVNFMKNTHSLSPFPSSFSRSLSFIHAFSWFLLYFIFLLCRNFKFSFF